MIPVQQSEVVIVGAGISGLALALHLGRLGHEVLLVDKLPAPRDKVCGEGIMPLGLRCLAALGFSAAALPGADFDGLDYLACSSAWPPRAYGGPWPHGSAGLHGAAGLRGTVQQPGVLRHALRFPAGLTGRGVRRTRLIEALERAALACPSVRCTLDEVRGVEWQDGRTGGRVAALRGQRALYRAAVFVAADGVNSRLAGWCGAGTWRYGERLALRRHYRLPREAMPSRVQVGLLGSHDLYLTPVGADELLATTLTDRAGYRAIVDDYDGFLRAGPYAEMFSAAEPASECLSWVHPLFHARRYVAGGVFLVGDAGGGIDPCLGMGMSLGLHTALAAGDAVAALLRRPGGRAAAEPGAVERAAAERAFARERKRLFLHYHRFGRVFRALVGSPRGARVLVWVMGRLPRMADGVLAIVADLRPWRYLGARPAHGPLTPGRQAARSSGGDTAFPAK